MADLFTRAELEQLLEDTGGVPVALGDEQTVGHFEVLDEVVLSETEILAQAPTVLIPTGALSGLRIDAAITVNGESWFVRLPLRVEDGAMTRVLLRR